MVLRIGHRGAAGHEPENTLRSFMNAIQLGADMTELDVHVCGSGELVAIHDERVDRTTDGMGYVAEMTLKELKSLDAGKGERIPTLQEVLSAIRGEIMLNIELKGKSTAEPVHKILTDYIQRREWNHEKILISSFQWDMLDEMRKLSSDMRLGVLAYREVDEALDFSKKIEAYSVNPYHGSIDADYVRRAHDLDLVIYPWTVNEPKRIAEMREMHVDGVISDYPDRIN